jgi:hypothetical protein
MSTPTPLCGHSIHSTRCGMAPEPVDLAIRFLQSVCTVYSLPKQVSGKNSSVVFVALLTLILLSGIEVCLGGDARALVIGKVAIEQRQVFDDPDTSLLHIIAPLANQFHILTDEEVIRRELLFKEGDPYDQRLIDESARNLRKLQIIGDVRILQDTLADSTVNMTVSTRDRWTLYPAMSLRQGGGVTGFGVSVRDDNFFGTAQKLNVGYNRLSDRTHPNGGEAGFTEPRLFGSWWTTSVQFKYADELRQTSFDVERPFYTEATTWAARAYADAGRVRVRQYESGVLTHENYLNQQDQIAWVATSTDDDTRLQLAAGYVRTRTNSDTLLVRPFDNVDLALASISILRRNYFKGNHLDNFNRVEDVPVGYQAGLTIGRNLHFSHAGDVDYFTRLFGQLNFGNGTELFGNYQASVTSYFIGNVPNEMIVAATAIQNWRFTENQTLLGRITTTIGSHLAPTTQVILGSFTGLRGYTNNELTGQRMLLMNFEERSYSGLNVWFLKFGGALFVDSGMLWNEGEGFGGQRFHSSVGLGIRVESSKNVGLGIFRFDIAYNLDQHRVGLIISTDHLFHAITPMEYVQPIPVPTQQMH